MFISRKNELAIMNSLYAVDEFKCLYIFGEKNIGKSSLIREFIKDKDSLFFSAYDSAEKFNLKEFSKKIYLFFGLPETTGYFTSWDDAFNFINKNAKSYKFVIVINNVTKLANEKIEFQEVLASYIKNFFISNKYLLILSGCADEFSKQIIASRSPLWGAQSDLIKLEELNFYDSVKLLGDMSFEDKIQVYNCLGGVPGYLAQVDQNKSAIINLKDLFFSKTGYLFLESKLILKKHLREMGVYNSILYSISLGFNKSSQIAEETGIDRNKLSKYLNNLLEVGIIIREIPYGDDPVKGRKGRYKIISRCIKFWYRFVFPSISDIENEFKNDIYDEITFKKLLETYTGNDLFKEICLQYLTNENKNLKLPFFASGVKYWWGDKKEFIVAYNHLEKSILICCFVFKEKSNDAKEILECIRISEKFANDNKVWFYFLSNRDFSSEAYEIEKVNSNITLMYL